MVDYREIVEQLDLRVLVAPGRRFSGDKPVMERCWWHEEKRQSMAIYPDHIFCYGCNRRQSLMEWIAEQNRLDIDRDFGAVVEAAARLAGTPPPAVRRAPAPERHYPIPAPLEPLDTAVARRYHDRLGAKRQWYIDRGLSDALIDEQLLGHDGRAFTIPVWGPGGTLLAVRFRRDDTIRRDGAKYWGMEGRNDTLLFNQAALKDNNDFVCVCEGELDCLRLWQEGIPAVSSTNGAGGMLRIWGHYRDRFLCRCIYITLDQDEAGRKAAVELRRLIEGGVRSAARGRAVVLRWDRRYGKDVTELAKKKGVGYFKGLIGAI